MQDYRYCTIKVNHSFYDIKNNPICIKWKGKSKIKEDLFDLSEAYFECACDIFEEILEKADDNIKLDMWFIPGVYMFRQSLELIIKALLAKKIQKKNILQDIYLECKHDLAGLFQKYKECEDNIVIQAKERQWIENYLASIEIVDSNSALFRYPFKDEFLLQYQNRFLDIADMGNAFLNAYTILKKCFTGKEDTSIIEIDVTMSTDFLIFANNGFGNCYLWESLFGDNFHKQVVGYSSTAYFLFQKYIFDKKYGRIFPIIFLLRNAIELSLKRLLDSKVEKQLPEKIIHCIKNSHVLYKELWLNQKEMIVYYAKEHGEDLETLDILDKHIKELDSIDRQGDRFRYPFSYSFEYRFSNIQIDMENVFEWMQGIFNVLDGCDDILDEITDFEYEKYNY